MDVDSIDSMDGATLQRLVGLFMGEQDFYAIEIEPAWDVVVRLSQEIGPVSVCWGIYGDRGNRCSVTGMFTNCTGLGETMPEAVCRFALKALHERAREDAR